MLSIFTETLSGLVNIDADTIKANFLNSFPTSYLDGVRSNIQQQIDSLIGLEGPNAGPTGPQGPRGYQGLQGIQGIQGPQGIQGDKGTPYDEMRIQALEVKELALEEKTKNIFNTETKYVIGKDVQINDTLTVGDIEFSTFNGLNKSIFANGYNMSISDGILYNINQAKNVGQDGKNRANEAYDLASGAYGYASGLFSGVGGAVAVATASLQGQVSTAQLTATKALNVADSNTEKIKDVKDNLKVTDKVVGDLSNRTAWMQSTNENNVYKTLFNNDYLDTTGKLVVRTTNENDKCVEIDNTGIRTYNVYVGNSLNPLFAKSIQSQLDYLGLSVNGSGLTQTFTHNEIQLKKGVNTLYKISQNGYNIYNENSLYLPSFSINDTGNMKIYRLNNNDPYSQNDDIFSIYDSSQHKRVIINEDKIALKYATNTEKTRCFIDDNGFSYNTITNNNLNENLRTTIGSDIRFKQEQTTGGPFNATYDTRISSIGGTANNGQGKLLLECDKLVSKNLATYDVTSSNYSYSQFGSNTSGMVIKHNQVYNLTTNPVTPIQKEELNIYNTYDLLTNGNENGKINISSVGNTTIYSQKGKIILGVGEITVLGVTTYKSYIEITEDYIKLVSPLVDTFVPYNTVERVEQSWNQLRRSGT